MCNIGTLFLSATQFREKVEDLSVTDKFSFVTHRRDHTHTKYRCSRHADGCPWRVHAIPSPKVREGNFSTRSMTERGLLQVHTLCIIVWLPLFSMPGAQPSTLNHGLCRIVADAVVHVGGGRERSVIEGGRSECTLVTRFFFFFFFSA